MGNNNSSQGNKSNNPMDDIHEKVNDMYNRIMGKNYETSTSKTNNYSKQRIKSLLNDDDNDQYFVQSFSYDVDVFTDPNKGINLPYLRRSNLMDSDLSSDGPKYIELIVCQGPGDINDLRRQQVERYAVHKEEPDHDCRANCPCIRPQVPHDTFSPTSEEPKANTQVPNQPAPTGQVGGQKNDDDTLSPTSDDDTTTTTSETKEKKKKNKKKDEDENDEDIDDIEIDDEDEDTEDGFMIEQSDINTSDLYKMQKRIFRSDTDTEDNYTDKVRDAMNTYNQRRKLFDSEDQDILGMNSTTDDYIKRPTNRNYKYH